MATQYKIRAKNSNTNNIFYVTIIGTFDPETDIKDPSAPNDPVDQDSITIVAATQLAEDFSLKDNYGIQTVNLIPSALSAFDTVSYDFSDITTWWQRALIVTDETPNTGDNLTYTLSNSNIINKRAIVDVRGFPANKELKIKVNGSPIDHYDPSIISSINYNTGEFTFANSQAGNTITASYAHVDASDNLRSTWTITPMPGTVIAIVGAKVKFSKNIEYNDTITLNIKAGETIVAQRRYFSMKDFIAFSTRWEILPAVASFTQDIIHLIFDYKGSIVLDSSLGMTAQLSLDQNIPYTCENAIVNFQCVKLK